MSRVIRVAELFAGVGGFRLGLEGFHDSSRDDFECESAGPFKTVWANQWEPMGSEKRQFAWRCYESHFGAGSCVNEDITQVLNSVEAGTYTIPDFDMLVGGFPCQDYSVARPLSQSGGIEGKKGVLWWQIQRILSIKKPKPRYILLENVDRLLKSPAAQRGRDFAIILACLYKLGYSVEWRVINAADYGMPQRRRRIYIFGSLDETSWNLEKRLMQDGVMQRAFPTETNEGAEGKEFHICDDPYEITHSFGIGNKVSVFENAGVMQRGKILTARVFPHFDGHRMTLGEIVQSSDAIPDDYYVNEKSLPRWIYCKGAKHEERVTSKGFKYQYSEGGMSFPDSLEKPSRTILTSEGGSGPSRMKHVVSTQDGRLRRLVPDELDQLQMFPKGWTDTGMSDSNRAFCMGNALVVGIPHAIGKVIAEDFVSRRA